MVCWLACALNGAFAAGATGSKDDGKSITLRRSGGDLFVAGSSVTLNEPVTGDLIAAGGSIDVDSTVPGDVLVVGGKVRLGADVGQTVFAIGGQLTVNGKVGRNLRVAGGQVELGPRSEIAGNVTVAGGQLRLQGTVKGHLQAAGGRVLIDGPVGGDVTARTGQLELGPNARIAGKLRYRSQEALVRDPAAQVAGGFEVEPAAAPSAGAMPAVEHEAEQGRVAGALGGVWTLGLVVCAALLLAAGPRLMATVSRTLRQRPGPSALLGFVFLVCLPVAAVIVFVTIIGIPLALLALLLYAALLPLGYIAAGIGLGDWALERWWQAHAGRTAVRIGAAAAVLVALALLGWVPVLGSLLGFLALLAGVGALLLQLRRPTPPAAAPMLTSTGPA